MWKLVFAAGVLIIAAGVTFTLQGLGIIGPASSFMFTDPAWVLNGVMISIVGLIAASTSLIIRVKKRS